MKKEDFEKEMLLVEQRKATALEQIAESLGILTSWFDEINKEDWGNRIQYYLSEWREYRRDELGVKDKNDK